MGEFLIIPQDAVIKNGPLGSTSSTSGAGDRADSWQTELDLSEIQNIELAVHDHLVGDLNKKACHSFSGVVVASDRVNHLDGVHQGRQGLFDGGWGALIQGIYELLKGLKVLDVVFGFVERLSDSELLASELGGCQIDLVLLAKAVLGGAAGLGLKNVNNGAAIFGSKLL